MRNYVGGTSSVQYEVARKESLSSSIRYEESEWWDYVPPVRSRMKGKVVLVLPVRGLMREGLLPSVTKSRNWRAGPRPSGTRNQACRTSFVQTKSQEGELVVVRPVRGIKRAGLRSSDTRNDEGGTSTVLYEVA